MGECEMNAGAAKLRESGRSAAEIAAFIAGRGVQVTRMTASNYRRGRTVPPDEVRAALMGAPFEIPRDAWDRPLAAAPMTPATSAVAEGATSVASPSPEAQGGLTAAAGARSAVALAEDLLSRIERWRAAAEAGETPAAAARFAVLEGRAIERLAKLRGEATAPEGELARSPAWARLRTRILEVVAEHPPTARKLLAVLEGHGQPTPGA